MIKVSCRVDPYEIDHVDTSVSEPRKLIVESHRLNKAFVDLQILDPNGNSKVFTLHGNDLIDAIMNCMRRGP